MDLYLKKILVCLNFSLPFNYIFCLCPPFSFLCPPFLLCFGLFEYFLYSIWAHLWFLSLCLLVVFFSWSYRDYNIHIYFFQSLLRIHILTFQMKCSHLFSLHIFSLSFLCLVGALCIISSYIENPANDGMVFSFNKVFLKELRGMIVYYVYANIYHFCCSSFIFFSK